MKYTAKPIVGTIGWHVVDDTGDTFSEPLKEQHAKTMAWVMTWGEMRRTEEEESERRKNGRTED